MNLKETIRPITYLETNAAEVLSTVTKKHTPVIITQNGQAKMVVQDTGYRILSKIKTIPGYAQTGGNG